MGRVFTPEAVAQHAVPELGAHEQAARFILGQFFEPQAEWTEQEWVCFSIDGHSSGIHSGLVYGSTALGTAGLRSDVDMLVNYHAGYVNQALPAIRATFQAAEDRYNVPVESQVLDVGALFNPLEHSIDPLFAEHLLAVQAQNNPRWSYNWPVDGLEFYQPLKDEERLRAIAVRYCSAKARHFTRAIVGYRGEADLHVLQRALELPGALGRKVIAATQTPEEEAPDIADKRGMAETVQWKLERFTTEWDGQTADYQKWLRNLDHSYDDLLNSTLEGDTSLAAYREWLQGNYIPACEMAREVAHV